MCGSMILIFIKQVACVCGSMIFIFIQDVHVCVW